MNLVEKIKAYVKANPHIWYSLLLPAFLIAYVAVELLVPSTCDYWVSYLPLDDKIPFIRQFILAYCMWYPLLFCVGIKLIISDGEGFKKYMVYMMSGFFITLLICLIFPNGQDLRPAQFETRDLFTWMVGNIYAADTNTNVFPSMHVIASVSTTIAAFKSDSMKRWRVPVVIISLLITASTVFVKQHSILDVFGAFALCIPLYFCVYGKRKGRGKNG